MAWNNEDLGAWMIKAIFLAAGAAGTVLQRNTYNHLIHQKNQQLKTRKQDYQRSGIHLFLKITKSMSFSRSMRPCSDRVS